MSCIKTFSCVYCEKVVTTKRSLDAHKSICVAQKFVNTIKEKDTLINTLQQQNQEKDDIINELNIELKKATKQNKKLEKKIDYLIISQKNEFIKFLDSQNKIYQKNTHNTIINNNIVSGVEITQKRFDKIVEDSFDFDLYEKGAKAGKDILIVFLSNEEKEVVATISDYSRDKIKVFDLRTNQYVILDRYLLFTFFKESLIFQSKLQEFGNILLQKNDPTNSNSEIVMKRKTMFLNEKHFTKNILTPLKSFIHNRNFNKDQDYVPTLAQDSQVTETTCPYQQTDELEEKELRLKEFESLQKEKKRQNRLKSLNNESYDYYFDDSDDDVYEE